MGLEALLYAHLNNGKREQGYEIIVGNGDLNQMMAQKLFLKNRGFDVRNLDVYPVMADEAEAQKALTAMWKAKVSGWWNMAHLFREHKTCTTEEFEAAMQEL